MSNCTGPTNESYNVALHSCVGSTQQTSCDEANQDTCYYAFLIDGGDKASWCSGTYVAGQGWKIHTPDLLANLGVNAGDIVDQVNGVPITSGDQLASLLNPYTEAAPASVFSVTHLSGRYQLSLGH